MQHKPLHIALVTGLLAAVLSGLLIWDGLKTNIDGKAYLEGSVSLLQGEGYVFENGERITQWPPGYSLYLAAWQAALGVSVRTVILSTIALAALAAVFWTLLLGKATASMTDDRNRHWLLPGIAMLVFLSIPVAMRSVHAMNLLFTLLPVHLLLLLHVAREKERPDAATAGLLLTAAVLPLVHFAGLFFVLPSALLLILRPPRRWHVSVFVVLFATQPVLIVRSLLQQTRSHPIAWDAGKEDAGTYILQTLSGTAGFFCLPTLPCIPLIAGLIVVLFLFRIPAVRKHRDIFTDTSFPAPLKLLLWYAGLSTLLLFAAFNFIWIHDPLSGRFLFPQMLILTAAAVTLAAQLRTVRIGKALAALILLPLLIQAGGLLAVYRFHWQEHLPRRTPEHFIAPAAQSQEDSSTPVLTATRSRRIHAFHTS